MQWFGESDTYVYIEDGPYRIEEIESLSNKHFVTGHIFYDDIVRFPHISRFKTAILLGEPYARLASHLRFNDRYNQQAYATEFAALSEQVKVVVQMIGSTDLNSPEELAKLFSQLPPWGRVAFDNCQTRFLACDPRLPSRSPYGELPNDATRVALERLTTFDVVGLTERFDSAMNSVAKRLGLPVPTDVARTNTGISGRTVDYNDADTREVMTPFVIHDLRVYEQATALLGG